MQRRQPGTHARARPASGQRLTDADDAGTPSLPVLALRVSALSRALSELTDTVMDALAAVGTLRKESRGGAGVAAGRAAGEITAKVMSSVMRSELALEERIRSSVAEELSCLEARLAASGRASAHGPAAGGEEASLAQDLLAQQGRELRRQGEEHFHAMLSAMDERLLGNDLAVKERLAQVDERLARADRDVRSRIDGIEEQMRQTSAAISSLRIRADASAAAGPAAQSAASSAAAPAGGLGTAVRDLAAQLHASRKRVGALEGEAASASAGVARCEKQQRSAVAALEALAADVSSLAEESRSIREWNRQAARLTEERIAEVSAASRAGAAAVADVQEVLRRLRSDNAALARRIEILELKSSGAGGAGL